MSAVDCSSNIPASSSPGVAGAYQARRSNKTTRTAVEADGAVWKERLAVCEGVTDQGHPKITIRSYYRNQVTQEKVWDEPPSGASEILFASSDQRKKADLQKQEMQLTLDQLPPDLVNNSQHSTATTANTSSSSLDANGSKKKGAGNTNKNNNNKGLFGRFKRNHKEPTMLQDDSKDLNLQRAIALSVAEANGKVPFASDPVTLHDMEGGRMTKSSISNDDDDMALAKALSMSTEKLQPTGLTEDELLQQALEASCLDSKRVPSPTTFDPYAPAEPLSASSASRSRSRRQQQQTNNDTPHKMESDEGKKKPGRSMKRRVLGGRKTIATQAGVV